MNVVHTLYIKCCLMSFRLQVFSVPSNAGGLRPVGPHLPSGVWRGRAGRHQTQHRVSAEQGASVEDVECDGQPAYRHHHTGRRRSSGSYGQCCCLVAII